MATTSSTSARTPGSVLTQRCATSEAILVRWNVALLVVAQILIEAGVCVCVWAHAGGSVELFRFLKSTSEWQQLDVPEWQQLDVHYVPEIVGQPPLLVSKMEVVGENLYISWDKHELGNPSYCSSMRMCHMEFCSCFDVNPGEVACCVSGVVCLRV